MAECAGQVVIFIDGKTNKVAEPNLVCPDDACGGKCKERPGRTWHEPDPDHPGEQMLISESFCSCDEKEPEKCHMVLEKNLTKHTYKLHCRPNAPCSATETCTPVKVKEETNRFYIPKDEEDGSGFAIDDSYYVMVTLRYECQCRMKAPK
jgi:hypothetical protein